MDTAPKKRATTSVKKPVGEKKAPNKVMPKKGTTARVKNAATSRPVTSKIVRRVAPTRSPLSAKKEAIVTRIASKNDLIAPRAQSAKKEKKVASTNNKPEQSSESVTLVTGAISLRLREKAVLYEAWYRNRSAEQMRSLAYVFGYLFIAVGTFSLAAFSSAVPLSQTPLFASILCSGTTETECGSIINTTSTSSEPVHILSPEVVFLSSILVEPEKDTPFEVQIKNASAHSVHYISRQTGINTELALAGTSGDDRYKYRIPTSTMDPGEYKIYVRVKSYSGTFSEFNGPTFMVPPRSVTETTNNQTAVATTSTSVATTSIESELTDDETEMVTIKDDEGLVSDDPRALDDEVFLTDSAPVIKSAATTTPEKVLVDQTPLRITSTPGVFPSQYRVEIIPTYTYTSVEMYVRSEQSTQPTFLGIASKTTNGWLYWLDATTLPAGKYRIIARGMDERIVKDVAELPFENVATPLTYTTTPHYTEEKKEVDTITTELAAATTTPVAPLADPRRPLLPALLDTETGSSSAVVIPLHQKLARELLNDNSAVFNDLLRRYGSALQSGDPVTLRLAEAAIEEKIKEIATSEVVDGESFSFVYEVEESIATVLGQIKKQVQRVEEFKRERTAAASSVDSDEDGISDFDEYLVYQTDPFNADTDTDGVIDGVEISLGFNPVDERPEAVIRFNSPKEVSYEDTSLLSVATVEPLLVYETDESVPIVQSEISGFGLPNSFVTLYIFSDPIVVIVKTKDDGSFSYTFSKELEDGRHEVYAALTDNAGQIVVRSAPFTFTKTAEAYTYAAAVSDTAEPLTDGGFSIVSRTYNIIAAMGVVSFGLILLLLGATLRKDKIATEVSVAV